MRILNKKYWPVSVVLGEPQYRGDKADDIYIWCRENFNNQWQCIGYTYYFRNAEDAMMFKLRWI